MNIQEVKEFLCRAKKETYAAGLGKIESTRPNSYDLEYNEGSLKYMDSYVGTEKFSGEEVVWIDENPIWAMNYTGRVIDRNFSSKFLKAALMNPTVEYPFRGQPLFQDGNYTYVMEVRGDFNWFDGRELIFYKDVLVYELNFHGGQVVDTKRD